MKLFICSDLHGDLESTERVLEAFDREGAERLIILGDILYHGPRNDLPKTYAPKKVIELLNARRDVILAVRGNCDTEVDGMVLNFPIMADYAYIYADGVNIFATHGHRHNLENLPPLAKGDVLLHGHTHVLRCEPFGNGNLYLNPGSASLPKEGNPRTYMTFEDGTFTVKELDGSTVFAKSLK